MSEIVIIAGREQNMSFIFYSLVVIHCTGCAIHYIRMDLKGPCTRSKFRTRDIGTIICSGAVRLGVTRSALQLETRYKELVEACFIDLAPLISPPTILFNASQILKDLWSSQI